MQNRRGPVTTIAFQFDGGNIPRESRGVPATFPRRAFLSTDAVRQTPICPANAELGYLPGCRGCPEIAITPLYYRNRLYKFGLRAFTRPRANRAVRHGV